MKLYGILNLTSGRHPPRSYYGMSARKFPHNFLFFEKFGLAVTFEFFLIFSHINVPTVRDNIEGEKLLLVK